MKRRDFIKSSSIIGVGSAMTFPTYLKNIPSEHINVAVVGLNSRGLAHITAFSQIKNLSIIYVCDVEETALRKGADLVEKLTGKRPKEVADFRKILNDKDLDAVSIATPDHWHTPAAILCCSAGKDVYVEKPCGQNPAEGEMLIKASARFNRLIQMGNQRRSWSNIIEMVDLIKSGVIGDVYLGKAWYNMNRASIGRGKPTKVPSNLNWELWQGPAPRMDFKDNIVHYNWHWFWNWGTGESCNNGTHEIDCLRWALGVDFPTKVSSLGGRYAFDDDWETPDTQIASFEFGDKATIVWEGKSCNNYRIEEGSGRGFALYGKEGTAVNLGGNDFKFYDKKNKLVTESKNKEKSDTLDTLGPGVGLDLPHFANFIDAIRNGTPLNSPITEGHKSVLLCHLANVSQRVGRTLNCDDKDGHILRDKEALKLWDRKYEKGWEPRI